ncbi:MAG: hypothetical protein ACJ780_07295, partial [Solirubrobacteraceae bacterium]
MSIRGSCLCVFGHNLNAGEGAYLEDHVCDLQIDGWPDRGHLVHSRVTYLGLQGFWSSGRGLS